MLSRFFAAIGRHRRFILIVALGLSAVDLAAQRWESSWTEPGGPWILATLVLVAITLIGNGRPGARAFDVDPQGPAFIAPPGPTRVLGATASLAVATALVGAPLRDVGTSRLRVFDLVILASWAIMLSSLVSEVWRNPSLELRPDGLRVRERLGSLFVPWEAMPLASFPLPANGEVLRVAYGRPELVRRRGLISRRRLYTDNLDRHLAAGAIYYYGIHPERRSAIGTEAEHSRLLLEVFGRPDEGNP